MVRVLKSTVVLDVSGLPATLGRFEIAKAVDDLYCEDFVVKSVQFLPGKHLRVVFDGPEAKNAAEQFMQAAIHGIICRVEESGPQVQPVNIYHYPYEEDNAPLLAVWLCLAGMEKCGISAINAIIHRQPSPLGVDLYGWCAKNIYLAPLMSLGMLSRRGMLGNRLSATFVARLTSPRTARLEANAINVCRRAM